jgi:hypothetical protein
MGARFGKWLARPTTLHFLRQLIGLEHAALRTKRHHWNALPRRHTRCYSAALAVTATHTPKSASKERDSRTNAAAAAASIERYHEQRQRVAQELGLRMPPRSNEEREYHGSIPTPSSTRYSDLLYSEARVRDFSAARNLLIDEPVNHANLEAWCRILEYRQRIDGLAGVLDVWDGMQKRGIDLPVDGNVADALWTTFLHAAIVQVPEDPHRRLLSELFAHAVDLKVSGKGHYRAFHNILVGRFLRVVPGGARKRSRFIHPDAEYLWHQHSCEKGLCEPQSLPFLVMDCLKSPRPSAAFRRWQKLYFHDQEYYGSEKNAMYDLCMPLVLLHADNPEIVIKWHQFFVSHNDIPSPDLASNRSVKYLQTADLPVKVGDHPRRSTLIELTSILTEERGDGRPSTSPFLSRAAMSGLVGDVHGIKPKAISDKFCARMFATQAFSLETSIRGLALLGTESLGPVALRELAIRANTLETLKAKLADVREAGIIIATSTYAHILETLIATSAVDLFKALLASDQHPENYDDQPTQETLLANFLQAEDWPSAHLTLIGISQNDHAKAARAWNRLLQHYMKLNDYKETVRIFDHLCSEQMLVTSRSLNFMMSDLLPVRAPSKKPNMATNGPAVGFAPLNFVVNAHMYAASLGQVLMADRWIELLKRYGMTGNIIGVERLASWLATRYPKQAKRTTYFRNGMIPNFEDDKTRLAMIFNPTMLRAMVIWGFRYEGVRDKLRPPTASSSILIDETPPWTRGIVLLSRLKEMGVQVKTADVRRAVRGILWTIFGPAVSKRRINLRLLGLNELTIMQYVKDANEAWDEPLFEIPSGQDDLGAEPRLLRAVFGSKRLADQKSGTWVDVDAWTAAIEDGMWEEPLPNFPDRRDSWSRSPFRIKDDFDTRHHRQVVNRKQSPSIERSSEDRFATGRQKSTCKPDPTLSY